jgi:hypothetical protein
MRGEKLSNLREGYLVEELEVNMMPCLHKKQLIRRCLCGTFINF